jgi:hypothetical protein
LLGCIARQYCINIAWPIRPRDLYGVLCRCVPGFPVSHKVYYVKSLPIATSISPDRHVADRRGRRGSRGKKPPTCRSRGARRRVSRSRRGAERQPPARPYHGPVHGPRGRMANSRGKGLGSRAMSDRVWDHVSVSERKINHKSII